MSIKVDYRETEFRACLEKALAGTVESKRILDSNGTPIDSLSHRRVYVSSRLCGKDIVLVSPPVNLDIGDIVLALEGYGEFIIERKRIDDLCASVKDGRYAEQKARCLSYMKTNPGHLIYLLEGGLDLCRNAADYQMALGCLISMGVRDKLTVVRVFDMAEGVAWLIRLAERFKAKPEEFFPPKAVASADASVASIKTIRLSGAGEEDKAEYLNTLKTKKKENITPEVAGSLMLAVIPGLSAGIAQIVLDTLGGGRLPGLIQALTPAEGSDEKAKKQMLSEIAVRPGRKLGPAMAEKIWDYLMGKTEKEVNVAKIE